MARVLQKNEELLEWGVVTIRGERGEVLREVQLFEIVSKDLRAPVGKKKAEAERKNYGDCVTMTEKNYGELISKYGAHGAQRLVEILDNYKGSTGKKYESDYKAILNWVVERYEEERAKGKHQEAPPIEFENAWLRDKAFKI